MLSGTGLSGSDRDDNESNLLWVSREVEVSNKVVEKFGIPHLIHSHTMRLPDDLFRMLYIVVDRPFLCGTRYCKYRNKSLGLPSQHFPHRPHKDSVKCHWWNQGLD